MTAGWLLFGAIACLAGFLVCIFSLLIMATRSDEEYERLARQPYVPPGVQRTHVKVIDWPRYDHEVEA